jgi:hypothetical protein
MVKCSIIATRNEPAAGLLEVPMKAIVVTDEAAGKAGVTLV